MVIWCYILACNYKFKTVLLFPYNYQSYIFTVTSPQFQFHVLDTLKNKGLKKSPAPHKSVS